MDSKIFSRNVREMNGLNKRVIIKAGLRAWGARFSLFLGDKNGDKS